MKIKSTLLFTLLISIQTLFAQSARSIESLGFGEISVIEMANNGNVGVGSIGQGTAFYNATLQTWEYFNTTNTPELKSDTINTITFVNINGVQNAFIGTKSGGASKRASVWQELANVNGANIIGLTYRPDSLWVLTPTDIVRFDSSEVFVQTNVSPISPISCSQRSSSCVGFWGGTSDKGCFVTKDGINFTYIDTSSFNRKLVDNRINAIVADDNCGAKYVGTEGGFSACFNGQPCQNFTTADGLPENDITTLRVDCKGRVWLGTRDSGIVIFENQTFTRLTTANGLSSNKITAIGLNSSCSEAWIGSKDGNITVVDSNKTVIKILDIIQDGEKQNIAVHIFPQPASQAINFVFEKEIKEGTLVIMDINGRAMQSHALTNVSHLAVSVSSLSSGMYFYQISGQKQLIKNGKLQVTK